MPVYFSNIIAAVNEYTLYDRAIDLLASYPVYWIIFGATAFASWFVSSKLKSRFDEYSRIPLPFTGKEVAERMLHENNITDVRVVSTKGILTDNYNPANKTINLSEPVYNSNSVSAAAVAAHETGHAIQHAQAYVWLGLRSKLVPVVQLSSWFTQVILLIGLVLLFASGNTVILGVGVVLLGIMALFALITLPVEFDASRRALAWLGHSNIGNYMDQAKAKKALFWAAMTYVVSALAALAMFVRFLAVFLQNRR